MTPQQIARLVREWYDARGGKADLTDLVQHYAGCYSLSDAAVERVWVELRAMGLDSPAGVADTPSPMSGQGTQNNA